LFLVCVPCHAARHRRPSRLTRFLSIAFRRPAPTPHTHQLERKAPPMCMCRIRIRSLECSTRSLAGGRRCTQTASSIATPLRRSCATSWDRSHECSTHWLSGSHGCSTHLLSGGHRRAHPATQPTWPHRICRLGLKSMIPVDPGRAFSDRR
jgi:hypothetical protein